MQKFTDAEYIRAFQEAVPNAFASLIMEYNFSLTDVNVYTCDLTSGQCVLLVGRDYTGVGASIKPLRADQIPKPRPPVPVACTIHEIINYLHPNLHLVYGNYKTPDEILPACERLAGYVQQYCKPMLEGDFSIWPKLLERRGKG